VTICIPQEIDEDSEAEKLSPLLVTDDDRSPEKSRSIKTEKSIDENEEVSYWLPIIIESYLNFEHSALL